MKAPRHLLTAILYFAPFAIVSACVDPPTTSFRQLVTSAPTVFTFQVTSASYVRESLGGGTYTEYVVGEIRVVEELKGEASQFKRIKYSFRGCGSVRISVGQLYLAATSQAGPQLHLWGTDQAILDLTRDFYHENGRQSRAVQVVKSVISGAAVPEDFPRAELESPLVVYPAPPPPPSPEDGAPNISLKRTNQSLRD